MLNAEFIYQGIPGRSVYSLEKQCSFLALKFRPTSRGPQNSDNARYDFILTSPQNVINENYGKQPCAARTLCPFQKQLCAAKTQRPPVFN